MKLYIISGVTGMTGSELARQLIARGDKVIGFDNFFASSLKSVEDLLDNGNFIFHEFDLNDKEQMESLFKEVLAVKQKISGGGGNLCCLCKFRSCSTPCSYTHLTVPTTPYV